MLPRICHPGGDWGYPVFTEFGTDLPELLAQAGFETEVQFGPVSEDDLAQVYVCRKPTWLRAVRVHDRSAAESERRVEPGGVVCAEAIDVDRVTDRSDRAELSEVAVRVSAMFACVPFRRQERRERCRVIESPGKSIERGDG